MNKLEQMHLDVLYDTYYEEHHSAIYKMNGNKAASKSAEITKQIVFEFLYWIELYGFRKDNDNKWSSLSIKYARKGNLNNKELFKEFLKTKQ